MISGEEWKEEAAENHPLDYAMAKRYAEAGTVFLFDTGGPILAGQIRKVSPNGQYALLGPESGPQAAWCPIEAITVLDVLVPMQERETIPMPPAADLLAALKLMTELNDKPKRKGKGKQ